MGQILKILRLPDGKFSASIGRANSTCDNAMDAINQTVSFLSLHLEEFNIKALPELEQVQLDFSIPQAIKDFATLYGLNVEFRYADINGKWMASYENCDVKDDSMAFGVVGRAFSPKEAIRDYMTHIQGSSLWLAGSGHPRNYATFA